MQIVKRTFSTLLNRESVINHDPRRFGINDIVGFNPYTWVFILGPQTETQLCCFA